MSGPRQRVARLIEPLHQDYPSSEQIAGALCEIHDAIDGKPGDPGAAYPLAERVRMVIEEHQQIVDEIRNRS